ncbi:YraN family protein [Clostridium sp. SM-530-WT-3G]|uniref:YraN family protein n=1 Tax=Clostridium sp. SM-530-WT-3G TaxID=2725303 RepID=UPI00145FBED5|nr:YraN family protein [Clostridium sp. SM-530-WT-3G]NME81762.1 YraN family protein [Clostridium sp. SM-530-WT-3G]
MKHFNKLVGNNSEKIAQKFLLKNGYNILDCNFRNRSGEIDIICSKNDTIIIIEVKSRYSYQYGPPKESVNYSKQKSIINVTKFYLLYKNIYNMNIRFDVIEVYMNYKDDSYIINHIKDAFRIN